ncbi:hypothetical protein [Polaromonas sp.]|nr:hypothetical protein [Polaromonas sp.]MDI1274171.1 hypothetical protein [Polaromonas sp.]
MLDFLEEVAFVASSDYVTPKMLSYAGVKRDGHDRPPSADRRMVT